MAGQDFQVSYSAPGVIRPKRATTKSAGHDIFFSKNGNYFLHGKETLDIMTGIFIEDLPSCGLISVHPTSGIFVKQQVNVTAREYNSFTVMQNKMKGQKTEIVVTLINLSKNMYRLNYGDKIAQIICRRRAGLLPVNIKPAYCLQYFTCRTSRIPVYFYDDQKRKKGSTEDHKIPAGHYGVMVLDRVGETKDGFYQGRHTLNGIIDEDYPRTVMACATPGFLNFRFQPGQRVGKLMIYKYADDVNLNGLQSSVTRTDGFGSTTTNDDSVFLN